MPAIPAIVITRFVSVIVLALACLFSTTSIAQTKVVVIPLFDTPAKVRAGSEIYTNSIGMKFSLIPAGSFVMGSPEGKGDTSYRPVWEKEDGRDDDETQHIVTLSKDFYMQTTEVTQAQYQQVMGNNPAHFSNCGLDCPVESVSWSDAQNFVDKLNASENRSGSNTQPNIRYSLPSEAQWEYAARGATISAFYNGDITATGYNCALDSKLNEISWYCHNAGDTTQPVAQKAANQWGLYDMSGNVWEWCEDWLDTYPDGPETDPIGPDTGADRVLRGGSWESLARYSRSAHRFLGSPESSSFDQGFRLVLAESKDTDGDGADDHVDDFPNDASETTDTDGDGVGDNADNAPNDDTRSLPENVFAVDSGSVTGAPTGKHWSSAFVTLQDAIDAAELNAGGDVWVAEGTYYPTTGTDRYISFKMKTDVNIYGGFAGDEHAQGDRDWDANETILSGDIGVRDIEDDNSHHVILGANTATLDGFIVEKGIALRGDGETLDGEAADILTIAPGREDDELLRVLTGYNTIAGGGMMNIQVSPTVKNTTFRYNKGNKAGAVYNMVATEYPAVNKENDAAYFENVIFQENYAVARGGAVNNDLYTSPTFVDVKFIDNATDEKGGGMYNDAGCDPVIFNALFVGNSAERGGALVADGTSMPTLLYSTIYDNTSVDLGAAIYAGTYQGQKPNQVIFAKSILVGNTTDQALTSISNWFDDWLLTDDVSYPSIFEYTDGDEDVNTYLTNAAGDDYEPVPLYTDYGWSEGRSNNDMGTDVATLDSLTGRVRDFTRHYVTAPIGAKTGRIYVDIDAANGGDGTSWNNAFNNLQDGLDDAADGAEIFVAEGTYYPTDGVTITAAGLVDDAANILHGKNERFVSFVMREGVAIYGGFDGTENDIGSRVGRDTILSGEIGNTNDVTDNSYHVVVAAHNIIFDGFIVRDGYAVDGETYQSRGAGMTIYDDDSNTATDFDLTVSNSSFINNLAYEGGGMFVFGKNITPTLENLIFEDNSAVNGGAMMIRVMVDATTDNLTFTDNYAKYRGGALYIDYGGDSTFDNCTFTDNTSESHGGAVYVDDNASQDGGGTNPVFTNCSFSGNESVQASGGALYAASEVTYIELHDTDFTSSDPNSAHVEGDDIAVGFGATVVVMGESDYSEAYADTNGDFFDYSGNGTVGDGDIPTDGSVNILLIIADDVGFDNISEYGFNKTSETPNIDDLAATGLNFYNTWANPMCSPSRASIYSGLNAYNHGVLYPGNSTDSIFSAKILGWSGYDTALFGKWHLGSGKDHTPIAHGYDYFAGTVSNIDGAETYHSWTKDIMFADANDGTDSSVNTTTYATQDTTDEAVAWITSHKDKPWFATVAYHAGHTPYHVPPDVATDDTKIALGTYPITDALHAAGANEGDACGGSEPSSNKDCFRGMVEVMDYYIGIMLGELDDIDVLDNTLVVFITDNGPGDTTIYANGNDDTIYEDNTHAKTTIYEGGIRVPLIMSNANNFNGNSGLAIAIGDITHEVQAQDVFSTIVEVGDATGSIDVDGISLLDYIDNSVARPAPTEPTRTAVYSELFRDDVDDDKDIDYWAMTDTDSNVKYVYKNDVNGEFEQCFELATDPGEIHNIYGVSGFEASTAICVVMKGIRPE